MHLSTALVVQLDTHLGLAGFGVIRLLGVLHIVTGHNIAPHDVLHTPLILIGFKLRLSGSWQCLQPKLQIGEFVQNFLRPGTVLYARQIDHNSRTAQTLDLRFGNTQLIDAIAQAGQVLTDGTIF